MRKINIKQDIKSLIYRFNEDDVLALGSQLAYALLLSLFPFLIFLLTVVSFSSVQVQDVLASLKTVLPDEAYKLIKDNMAQVLKARNTKLLSISLIITIWTAASGFSAVIKGLNKAYDEEECRSFIKLNILSLIFTVAVVAIIAGTFILLIFGEWIDKKVIGQVGSFYALQILWHIIRYAIIILSMLLVFISLYHYAPCKRVRWRAAVPGALFSTVCWIGASLGFAFYVNNFGKYAVVYGSLGAVIMLMTWLFFTSVIVILGGEINATLALDAQGRVRKKGKKY